MTYIDEVVQKTGASLRQLDTWTTKGLICTEGSKNPGSGQERRWSEYELRIAALMVRLRKVGFELPSAAVYARMVIDLSVAEGTASMDVSLGPNLWLSVNL
jgi:DNA-binding transcriptional MerR regulator